MQKNNKMETPSSSSASSIETLNGTVLTSITETDPIAMGISTKQLQQNGDFVTAIKILSKIIDLNNNNINNGNNSSNNSIKRIQNVNNNQHNNNIINNNNQSNGNIQWKKNLSSLYSNRSQCYLNLGLHQLALDDALMGSHLNPSNEQCHYLKGCALLGLKQIPAAESAFQMALGLRDDFSEARKELVNIRYKALKDAGFDEETATNFAQMCSSVNEAIDAILSRSLTASEISDLRASFGGNFFNISNNSSNESSASGVNSKNFNSTVGVNGNGNAIGHKSNTRACDSQSLNIRSDMKIGNFKSIHDSDDHRIDRGNGINLTVGKVNNNTSATNSLTCDTYNGSDCLISRSVSPPQYFQISDLMTKPKTNSFSINFDLNKLGSHILSDKSSLNERYGSTDGGVLVMGIAPKKTFADIASTNTVSNKAVQPPKGQSLNTKITSNVKSNGDKLEKERELYSRSPHLHDSGKISSLETFNTFSTIDGKRVPSPVASPVYDLGKPINLMGYKGLWVCNITPDANFATLKKVFRKYGNFTGLQTFERKATNGSNIVFVHYDNADSPRDAIADLFGVYRKDICFDEITPLKLRFTPSMEQTKSGEMPTMEKAKKIVEKSGECFNWRLSSGCHKGERCTFKHIPINKSIDSQPWVKALKKKMNET